MNTAPTLLKIGEVARMLTVSPRTVQTWVSEGIIPHLKIGGATRFKLADIERILDEGLPRHGENS